MEKRPLGPRKALRIANGLFCGGLGALLILYLVTSSCGDDDMVGVFVLLAVLAMIVSFGGIFWAYTKVRCPYCGASLMPGGRLPSSLPHFCSSCGHDLDGRE